MGKKPDARAEPAHELYKQGMKLVDIASKLNVPPGTVRRWKSTYKWEENGNATERSNKKGERSERKNERSEKEANVRNDVEQVIDNDNLTDKQKLFCLYYIRCFSATKAYQKAFGCNYNVANAEGYKMLVKPCVKDEIMRLKQNRLNRQMLDEYDILQKYIDIAFADMNDFMKIGEYSATPKPDIDGTIISEISTTANGVKIKLSDRMKAMDWLANHMNMLTEEQKARVAVLKKQAEGNIVDENNTGVIVLSPVLPDAEDGEDDE